jgi:hypothetical protein
VKFNYSNIEPNVKKNTIILSFTLVIFLLLSDYFYAFLKLGDDTYIYLQYARNIIQNQEISFNHGEKTYGFTSPLWLGLITLLSWLSNDFQTIPHILTLSFSILSILI